MLAHVHGLELVLTTFTRGCYTTSSLMCFHILGSKRILREGAWSGDATVTAAIAMYWVLMVYLLNAYPKSIHVMFGNQILIR